MIILVKLKNTLTFGVLILLSIILISNTDSKYRYHTYVYITSHTLQIVNKANSDILLLYCVQSRWPKQFVKQK